MDLQIQLKHIHFNDLQFKVDPHERKIPIPLETSLGFGVVIFEDNKNRFAIVFDIKLTDKESKFFLTTKATAHFETDKPVWDDFQDSPFAKINAPAIAFPYIRTFISNLTLNSGYNPIILPSFNFVRLAEEKQAEENKIK